MTPPDAAGQLPPILPEDMPVAMPDLPPTLQVTTEQQFKAVSDPMRGRIIQVLRTQPATAKQLADLLGGTTGAVGHHLQVLEAAGLVQIVARRLIHGIVAKYYTRTARTYIFNLPRETAGTDTIQLVLLTQAREELIEALPTIDPQDICDSWFPHKRLSLERMAVYWQRLDELATDFLRETPDPTGATYSLVISAFRSPAYLQAPISSADTDPKADD